jgi:DNA repair protein RecO (recombination protein O)
MAAEKAQGLVLRTTDWSESSRIATLWTREFGKVRALAKGGRRLKSAFENALDLLTVCSIVFLRKSSGSLDLLTEAQVVRRFGRLGSDLAALYAGYYVAELLADWTEDYDPHPGLYDEALATLDDLGGPSAQIGQAVGPRVARFEMVLLRELGYSPVLDVCAACGAGLDVADLTFAPAAGGVVCPRCQVGQRERRPLSVPAWQALRALAGADKGAPTCGTAAGSSASCDKGARPAAGSSASCDKGARPAAGSSASCDKGARPAAGSSASCDKGARPAAGSSAERREGWRGPWDAGLRAEVRQVLGQYITHLRGRRPRLLAYLEKL